MNKTDRKNNINMKLNWPERETLFTIKDLLALNPDFKEITLRVRVSNALGDKSVVLIGHKNQGKGRPTNILSMSPVTQEFCDKAYATGIQPPDIRPTVSTTVYEVSTQAVETPVTEPMVNETA